MTSSKTKNNGYPNNFIAVCRKPKIVATLSLEYYQGFCSGRHQGGHKPGKHGKPGKLREFQKLSKSQGKLKKKLNLL